MNFDFELFEELNKNSGKTKLSEELISNIYEYHAKGGFNNILISQILNILSIFFRSFFIFFVFIMIDWSNILLCGNNIKDFSDGDDAFFCGHFSDYLNFANLSAPNFLTINILCLIIGLVIYGIFQILALIKNLKILRNVQKFYIEELYIFDNQLFSISWNDIATTIANNNNITVENISHIIMRKENYFIGLINNDILSFNNQKYFNRQLEYNIYKILFEKSKYNFYNVPNEKLKKRFMVAGFINLILSPFILIYIIISFIFSNIDELYINRNLLGPRRYTRFALWKFREYNELPHFFKRRINKSIRYANEYITQFPAPLYEIFAKFIGLISGAFIFLLLVLSLLDESILLYVSAFNRSLIFYAGIFTTISAFCRSYITEPGKNSYEPKKIMNKLEEYLHNIPNHWKNKGNTIEVKNEFLNNFCYRIELFLYDIFGVITTPYLLLFEIPKYSDNIRQFLFKNTVFIQNVGNICSLSNFSNEEKDKKMELSISSFNNNYNKSIWFEEFEN